MKTIASLFFVIALFAVGKIFLDTPLTEWNGDYTFGVLLGVLAMAGFSVMRG